MATQVDSTSTTTADQLTPVLSSKYALRWQHAVLCSFYALLFLYLSYIPLPVAGTWLHTSWGKWMLDHRALPSEDPFLPLAKGMTTINSSWLSHVMIAKVEAIGGAEVLTSLVACSVLATMIVWGRTFYLQTGAKRFALLGLLLIVGLSLGPLSLLQPQVFGGLCLALLIWMLGPIRSDFGLTYEAGDVPLGWRWVAVPLLMIVWCNLDGSWLLGMVVLACHAIGRFCDVVWQSRSFTKASLDKSFQRAVWLGELALIATLLNPLGLDLWAHAIRWTNNPFWQAAGDFRPVILTSWYGIRFAIIGAVCLVALRHSRRRVSAIDCLLITVSSIGFLCNTNLLIWFAPVAAYVMVPHLAEIYRRSGFALTARLSSGDDDESADGSVRFAFSLVCLLIVWCGFALSPASSPLLGGKPRKRDHVYQSQTPWTVSEYLTANPPTGLVWAPADWSDWLVWTSSAELKVYTTSSTYHLPKQARFDYAQVFRAEGNWQRTLDRYAVGMLVVDKQRQKPLLSAALRAGDNWSIAFEDEQALVLKRRES